MKTFLEKVHVKKFRNLKNFDFQIGKNLTVISGHNGVGKSNLLSLIASGSGTRAFKPSNSSSFHPEFIEYFHINNEELTDDYEVYLEYSYSNSEINDYKFYKRLSLKNDSNTERGIRIIPRASNYSIEDRTINDVAQEVKDVTGTGRDARVQIPTMFLSLSRLYPLGETNVKVDKAPSKNNIKQSQANEKYKKWYNEVLSRSISNDTTELLTIEKDINKSKILHMEIKGTPIYSQSVGQDSLGSIISALVDFYLIHNLPEYVGGILCIDEIDVSLHPDAQINLLNLLDKLSKDLKIQIIMSTHSLTIIKEILKKQKRSPKDYNLVYLKNSVSPFVMSNPTYTSIKSDLFLSDNHMLPKLNIYFEDDVAKRVYTELLLTAEKIYIDNSDMDKIKKMKLIKEDCNLLDVYLGCDALKKLLLKDYYFRKVCIILDGDARSINKIKDNELVTYLETDFTSEEFSPDLNIVYLPTFFFPEFYVYRVINKYVNSDDYSRFWRSLDNNFETKHYTQEFILKNIILDKENINRNNIKQNGSIILDFIEKTKLLYYYYSDLNNFDELDCFIESLYNSINILKKRIYSEK